MPVAARTRLEGIDAFRYVAFFAVAVLHCLPSHEASESVTIINHATRFAVPFFFIASGYFLGLKDPAPVAGTVKLFMRLAPIFIFWALIYVALFGGLQTFAPKNLPHFLLTGQPGFHLWFLPSLGIGAALLLALKRLGLPALLLTALVLYALALMFDPYRQTLGLPDPSFHMRNGPFFSFPCIFIGYVLARRSIKTGMKTALLIAMGGLAIQIEEAYIIAHLNNAPLAAYNFTLGTPLFALGVFLLAITLKPYSLISLLSKLGSVSLGMYCVHVLFLKLGLHVLSPNSFLQDLALILFVVAFSSATGLIMARVSFMRKFVT